MNVYFSSKYLKLLIFHLSCVFHACNLIAISCETYRSVTSSCLVSILKISSLHSKVLLSKKESFEEILILPKEICNNSGRKVKQEMSPVPNVLEPEAPKPLPGRKEDIGALLGSLGLASLPKQSPGDFCFLRRPGWKGKHHSNYDNAACVHAVYSFSSPARVIVEVTLFL